MSKKISVIIPVLDEEENIPLLCSRLAATASDLPYDFEFLFVDDGSVDDSCFVLKKLSEADQRIKVVKFSRNFGSHAACFAGLMHAKGTACVFMSADLQDPPELIRLLAEQWERGFDIVLGVREPTGGGNRTLPSLYWKLVRRFALKNMPENGTDVFMIDRKVMDAIVTMKEKNTSVFGLILWSGFTQAMITYKKMERHRGKSKWTLSKKVKLFIDTFVSFSYFPVRMISIVGILLALTGFIYASIVIVNRIFLSNPIEGWTSLVVIVLLTSGVQMLMLGILGEYLWRNFDEARNRPAFIVSELIGIDKLHLGDS